MLTIFAIVLLKMSKAELWGVVFTPYLPTIGHLSEAFLGNYNISICTIILSVKERDG